MSAGTDHDLKVLTERVEMHGDTLADLDSLTVKQSRAIDDLTSRLAELERRMAGPTKRERSAVDDEDNQSTAVGLTALEIADLPIGSVVEDKEGRLWDRLDDGDWYSRLSDGITRGSTRHGWHVLHKLHGPFRKVSEPVRNIDDFEPLESLSVGALVRTTNGVVWEKQGDGMWSSDSGSRLESVRLWVRHGPVFTLVRE